MVCQEIGSAAVVNVACSFPLSEPNANVQSDQPSQLEPDSYLFLTASDRQINFATFLHEHAFDAPFRESRRRLTIDGGNQIVSLQTGIRPWRVRYNLSDSEHFDAAILLRRHGDSAHVLFIRLFEV